MHRAFRALGIRRTKRLTDPHCPHRERPQATTTTNEETANGPINTNFLSLLISADTSAMMQHLVEHFCLVDGAAAATNVLPHIKHCEAIIHVLHETSRGPIVAPGWQYSHETATPLSSDSSGLLSNILICFSQLYSSMLFASAAQHFVFGGAASELFASPQIDPQAPTAKPKVESAAVSNLAIGAIFNLEASLSKLIALCSGDSLRDIDGGGHNLCRTISFCNLWAVQAQSFMKGCIVKIFNLASGYLQEHAEALESSIPRWTSLFPPGPSAAVDWDLVVSRMLQNPRRPTVLPMMKYMKAVLAQLKRLNTIGDMKTDLDAGINSFIHTTLQTAENYMMICAAVNTLTLPANSNSSKSAGELLDIATRTATLELPDSLKYALQQATMGKRVATTGKRSSASTTTSTTIAPTSVANTSPTPLPLPPPPKRAKVEAEARVDEGASASSAQATAAPDSDGSAIAGASKASATGTARVRAKRTARKT